jgi:hypothetical protein
MCGKIGSNKTADVAVESVEGFDVVTNSVIKLWEEGRERLGRSEFSVVGRELYLSVELSSVGGLGALFLSAFAIFLFIISNISQHLCYSLII